MVIQVEDQKNQNLGMHNFVEKYLPIRTQLMISECIANVFQDDTRRRLKEYERIKYADFHQVILKDDGVHKIEYEMKRVLK